MPTEVHTLDLHFQGVARTIASYLIPHSRGAVLIEAGPGSTIPELKTALSRFDLTPAQVTDVFLTHIHLDHAGAAGSLARQGARIHVHPKGAPHLLDPTKLINSATRIYGDAMDRLWGEFLPVPEDHLNVLHDGQEIKIEGLSFRALDTPGHADHHYAYLFEDICFTGDVGGVRLPGPEYLCIPMPPPEFHLGKWRDTLQRLRAEKFSRVAPTHFGIFDDRETHLALLERGLDEVEEFLERVMPGDPSIEDLTARFQEWVIQRAAAHGLDRDRTDAYEIANPSAMSAGGIHRYWRKYRSIDSSAAG